MEQCSGLVARSVRLIDIVYSRNWKEPKNHIRPEADGGVVGEGISTECGEHRDGMEEKEVMQETVMSKD